VNADEHRRLRAALYRPLLGLGKEERGRVVDLVLAILLDEGSHASA
jgi:type I restriction enzyme, R subunit